MSTATRYIAGEDLREALEDSESYDRIICVVEAVDSKTTTDYAEILYSYSSYSCIMSEYEPGHYCRQTWKFISDKESETSKKELPNVVLLFIRPDNFYPANISSTARI